MPLKHRILLAVAVVVVLGATIASPLLVADGVRAWIWWTARQEKLTVKIDKVDAPFLRPVVLHNVSLTSAPNSAYRIDARATSVILRLNFQRILLRTRGRILRHADLRDLHLQIHRNQSGEPLPERTWQTWQRLLPDSANFERFDLRVEDDPVVAIVRGGALSFSEIEPGRFSASEITIASPFVRQTFAPIRAGARWQDLRLTFAGLSLTRGLDLQSITFDFARLSKEQIGIEFDVDAFGGAIRGNVTNDWRNAAPAWTLAASASNISLAQTAQAVGYADRVTGQMRAGKFIFRGDARDAKNTTASIWAELAAPAWRDRKADVIMLGASFYNRKIDIQQVYIKQRANELTLSGEAPLPNKWSDWLSADFNGNISGALKDLGEFANLLGGKREEFHGSIAVNGAIDAHARKISGELSASGQSLMLFGSPVDRFDLKLNIADGVADIAQFNFQRARDFLRIEGKIDMFGPQGLRGTVELNARNIADYFKSLPPLPLSGRLDFTGRAATFADVKLGAAPNEIPWNGRADFSDPQKLFVTLQPLALVGEVALPNDYDCIDAFKIVPAPRAPPLPPRVNEIELRGSFPSGFGELVVREEGGEKTYRLNCAEGNNRPLQLAVGPKP